MAAVTWEQDGMPGLRIQIDRMGVPDIPEVMAVERDSFSAPWPGSAYRRELTANSNAHYFVLRSPSSDLLVQPTPEPPSRPGLLGALLPRRMPLRPMLEPQAVSLLGYAGLWLIIDEAHVTTIAVRPQFRGRGYGELLLVRLIETALSIDARWLTLEVRVSNTSAQNLYRKYTFRDAGIRKRYYTDNNEDALIMWTEELQKPAFLRRYEALKSALYDRLAAAGDSVE